MRPESEVIETVRQVVKKWFPRVWRHASVWLIEDRLIVDIPFPISQENNKGTPVTGRRLANLKNALEAATNLQVTLVLKSPENQGDLENGINALINTIQPGAIDQVLISSPLSNTVDVIMTVNSGRSTLSSGASEKIKSVVQRCISLAGLEVGSIHIIGFQKELPTTSQILASLKTIQPAQAGDLAAWLINKGFGIPREKWVESQMDALRKKGLVASLKTKSYVLTQSGLEAVPGIKGSVKSDVARALAMRGRKWV